VNVGLGAVGGAAGEAGGSVRAGRAHQGDSGANAAGSGRSCGVSGDSGGFQVEIEDPGRLQLQADGRFSGLDTGGNSSSGGPDDGWAAGNSAGCSSGGAGRAWGVRLKPHVMHSRPDDVAPQRGQVVPPSTAAGPGP